MKKWLGRIMITVPFVAVFVWMGLTFGFDNLAIATGVTAFGAAWVFIAFWLLDS